MLLLQNGGIKADPVADYTLYFDRYTVLILSEGLLTDTRLYSARPQKPLRVLSEVAYKIQSINAAQCSRSFRSRSTGISCATRSADSTRIPLLITENSSPTRRRLPEGQNSNILFVNNIITNWAEDFISGILFGFTHYKQIVVASSFVSVRTTRPSLSAPLD